MDKKRIFFVISLVSTLVIFNTTLQSFAEPPLKQIANGVLPEDVVCKEGLQLIFKSGDNSPACVKSQTAEKLVKRGWALKLLLSDLPERYMVETSYGVFETKYLIEGGSLNEINFHDDSLSFEIFIESKNDGKLIFLIPKEMISQWSGELVLIDDIEVSYKKIDFSKNWLFIIEFPSKTEKIVLAGFIWL